ncbi:hypothetical protein [Mesorhizobium sp.]|uniref:hypothetical protein n=1 Tax=Mesorhizobium sp. TaxID=1871066 RepID=UPI0025BDF157|nr:hypothetical protein [Mesorhizobium sp.]
MAKIEGFRIKNFRALHNITLGRLWNDREKEPLTPMTAVIGKNGSGKVLSLTLLDFWQTA